MQDVCPLCGKRVSDWEASAGKTTVVNGKVVHKACMMDHDWSVSEIEKRLKGAA